MNKKIQLAIQKIINCDHIPSDTQIQSFIEAALLSDMSDKELTLRIVDQDESQGLNYTYRQKNKPTNVLAFPYNDEFNLGDLVVCAPIVEAEAKAQNKAVLAHWAHLLIHGTLHLQGYDHIENDEREVMEDLEVKILKKLGFDNPYV